MARIPDPHRDVRWAWGFVVLIVAGGILAQFIGYGIALALGYGVPQDLPPPLGAALLIAIPAVVVAAAPGVAALIVGVRAGRGGRYSGYLAAGIGALSVAYWLVVVVASVIDSA